MREGARAEAAMARRREDGARPTRRAVLRAAGTSTSGVLLGRAAAAGTAVAVDPSPDVYRRLGVEPFLNLTCPVTLNGGLNMLPSVREAMDAASRHYVNLDELMEGVGARLARLMGVESAVVTSGCASAIALATAACVAGSDPERMQQLPDTSGLRDEVVVPRASRNEYDQAIRMVGVRIREIETRDDLAAALGPRTAMIYLLGGDLTGAVGFAEIVTAARGANVPVLVDAASEPLERPDPYLGRGVALVARSGGKILRGPQCTGLLAGRRDLVRAAWLNGAPHHAFGRPLKTGKEEIVGMLAAVEAWFRGRDLDAERRAWRRGCEAIAAEVNKVEGVTARVRAAPRRMTPYPDVEVVWDPRRVGLDANEVGRRLLAGKPRIMAFASGPGCSISLRTAALEESEHRIVAARIAEVLRRAPAPGAAPEGAAEPTGVAGEWELEIAFVVGTARHLLHLESAGGRLSGWHQGRRSRGEVAGTVRGAEVAFRSALPIEGAHIVYAFTGSAEGDRMSGKVDLGEYGSGRFTASRKG
jgi:L-seryl-tRNA(Ser) seleniumtransferase